MMAYFTTAGGTLWSIDGNTQEIKEVKVFAEDPIRWVGEQISYLDSFCRLKDSIYFVANRTELWKSDGTSEGTTIVETLNDTIIGVSAVNDHYLLLAVGSNQMRASDGSSASTILTMEAEAPILRGWKQDLVPGSQKALFLALGN
ncbi:unnamed protein product [Cylindrotheca closterium]|uniref:Uncharacterized protein n=1 Tax=Cylindrotheca closterium TaxID=2856 RepID=A0AAD2PXD4_9STRA|nr:unnamed protein product [Cylindrotheca closterium]